MAAWTGMYKTPISTSSRSQSGRFHPIVHGLEDATRIINGANWVHVRPNADVRYSPLTLVPSYPDLPMEEVYPRVERTDTPGVYARETGKGRVIYFPCDIDRTFWEVLSSITGWC